MGRFCPIEGKLSIVVDQHKNVLIVNPLQQKWAAECWQTSIYFITKVVGKKIANHLFFSIPLHRTI